MDIEGRLLSAHRRSQIAMMQPAHSAVPATSAASARAVPKTSCTPPPQSPRYLTTGLVCLLLFTLAAPLSAQSPPQTGPQQLSFAGLRSVLNQGLPVGQINAVQVDAQGDLYLLLDQKHGVRILKTDSAEATVLAQTQIGAQGDTGLAMSLDPSGNVYVTGTTTSGVLRSTSAAAFSAPFGSTTSSFVAKFDSSLNTLFVTFAGGGSMSATSIASTADAVFITGSIFAATLPVTPAGIIQAPAFGSTHNGFVEKFSANGSTLLYATYLSGVEGNTTPAAIAADSADNAYVAGTTTSPGYPTIAAVVPEALGTTSGFLTKLAPAGDGILFSTFIPGAGITSLALDPVANHLLLSGSASLGQFPVATVSAPLAATTYQVLLRMPLDGSTVLASTLLAPGTQSFVAAGPSGTAWVDGNLTLPLLPLTPLSTIGNSFTLRVNSANVVDQTARFGGIAASDPANASAAVALTSIAVDPNDNPIASGSFTPSASQSLLATQTYDLPLATAPTAAFPSTVRSTVPPPTSCSGSLCAGSAAYLAKLTIPATASAATAALALSVDDSPNLTLRNLGSAEAINLQLAVTGFNFATNCGITLPAGGECSVALTGNSPGSITVAAANAITQAQTLPALSAGAIPLPIVFSPRELDFGIVSSASGPVTRTITVTNLTQQSQTFTSAFDTSPQATLPYTFAETASDCNLTGASTKLLAPDSVCHITIGVTASNLPANDGPIRQNWLIGTRDVQMTAYAQATALSLSAPEIDFGTQYTGGPRLPRYLYLSNISTVAIQHTAVTLPAASPFSVTDACPALLEPQTVCQLQLAYRPTHTPATDSVTLSLDEGLTALVTGKSLPQPATNGASINPNLSVSATSLNFANAVVVTGVSSTTQSLTVRNTGASPFTLALALTGDFTDATNCGASLAGGAFCSVVLTFVPSQPGTRQGLLAITAGAGTTPDYVTLSGVGTGILSPANNGTLSFGSVLAGQPSVQWFKVTQPFTGVSFATTSTTLGSPFTAILVEDIGYGHGQPPPNTFSTSASGTCINCWLGIQFKPAGIGPETGTLALTSATTGSPYTLSLTGNGLPLSGLLLTPVARDLGPVSINSTSGTSLFTLTNLVPGGGPITISTPAITGDFAAVNTPTGGTPCGSPLAYTASCFVELAFTPTATGTRSGTLTLQTSAATATAALTGYGSPDPGLSLNPTALTFDNVPGTVSTQQTITLTNTSAAAEQIAAPIPSTPTFSASTNCATLVPGATCSIAVTFTPSAAPAAGTLAIPVTTTIGGAPVLTTYSVPLTSAYTTEDAGLEIVPSDAEFGPQATGAIGATRQFTINNLTAKSLALAVGLPRQFVLAGPPCSGLAPYASCNFSVSFLPLTNGNITGTLFALATPTDGSATLNGLGYVEGYGTGAGSLSVSGGLMPGDALSFGQIPSGQSAQRTLTLTNTSATASLTIRRISSEWPFFSTTTCGAPLAPAANCTVALTYSPVNQVAAGSSPPPTTTDTGTLVIESDAASSPDLIDLAGTSTPATVASPANEAPLIAFTPSQSSLTFANTMVGTASAPQTVTLDHTGTTTISILGVETAPDFTVTSNCTTIAPGASCPIAITFTPQNSVQQGSGTRVGAVEISSNASTSLEFISLMGVSSPSTLAVAPASLNYGAVLVGTSASLSVQLTNTGSSAVTLTGITATGDYSTAIGTCPPPGNPLAPGAGCALQVTFAPMQSGARAGTLSIASSATTAPLIVSLTGTGMQSHLQITPSSLSFGSIAVGASTTESLTLANTGTAPITGIASALTGDYAVTVPCAVTTLVAGGSCSITLAFTPSATGTRAGTLTVISSDALSPATISLTGTAAAIIGGSFTLTVNGSSTASASVSSGEPAAYNLTITPTGNFTGTVVLSCTPVTPAQYATCSLQPSSVTLSGATQTAIATLNTVTSIAEAPPGNHHRTFGDTAFALLFPAIIFTWKARTSRHPAWRKVGPIAWAIFAAIALLSANGCSGNNVSPTNLRYAPTGTYQYQITASSTSGPAITQTVTLNLTVR